MESGTATLTVPSTENCLQVKATPVNSTCGNPNGSITMTAAMGTLPYSYSRDGVNFVANNVFSGLAAGVYTLVSKDAAGLSGTVQATITDAPGPSISSVSAPPFCSNTPGTIAVNATGGTPPLQYSLDNGLNWQPSDLLPVRAAGQYPIVVQDANGCTATVTQTVTTLDTPIVQLGNDTAICTGDSLLLRVSGAPAGDQFLWQDNSTTNQFMVRGPGPYSVTVSNSVGCSAGDTIIIKGKATPIFSLSGQASALCAGQPIILDPHSLSVTYLWSTGSTAPSITVTQPGLYWLEENLFSCLRRDSITLNFKPTPPVHLGNDTTLCDGQILLLDATSPGATYRWQDGSTAPEFKVQSRGTYTVQVNVDGCDSSGSIAVTYISKPQLNIVPDTTLCISQQLVLDASYPQSTYLWQDGSTQPQFRVTTEGMYTVQVTNTCGTAEDTSIVKFNNCDCKFYVPNGFTPNGDGHNDVFRPTFTCRYAHFELRVFGRWGQLLFDSQDPAIGWDGTLRGTLQPPGTYVWMMSYQDQLTGKTLDKKGTVVLIR
jgi:gliding motility-associated-like protein